MWKQQGKFPVNHSREIAFFAKIAPKVIIAQTLWLKRLRVVLLDSTTLEGNIKKISRPQVLLVLCSIHKHVVTPMGTFMLAGTISPFGITTVCPEAILEIICSTSIDRHFLNWNVTIPPSASYYQYQIDLFQQSECFFNTKVFIIAIVSTMDQFTSILLVVNVTDDLNGTMVQCTDIIGDSAAESRTAMTFVHIIQTNIGR